MESAEESISPRRPPRWLFIAGGVLILLVLVLAGVGYYGYQAMYRPVRLSEPQTVDIRAGASFGYVATRLEQRGLIPNAAAFKVYAYLTRQQDALKIGEYEVVDGQRPVDILNLLVSGRAKAYWVTIPEGKWASEVPGYLKERWPDAAGKVPELIQQPELWRDTVPFPLEGNTLEGYLFPDTYRFPRDVSAEGIVTAMLERFETTCWAEYQRSPAPANLSFYEVLILASLVESEAQVDEERPIIAGVYINRLREGWRMECDATLLYARQERLNRVLNIHKEIASPYNTYKHAGLPPGPINNPGLDSFKAAMHPADVEYFFYVAEGDGSHVFTRTLAEHNAAIRRIRGQ